MELGVLKESLTKNLKEGSPAFGRLDESDTKFLLDGSDDDFSDEGELVKNTPDSHQVIVPVENDIYQALYNWTYCSQCGSTRKKTFLSENHEDLVCEYCSLIGKNVYRLPRLVWRHFFTHESDDTDMIKPDTTLNSVTDYLVEALLPALECRYDEKQAKLLAKSEPATLHKNGLSSDYNTHYLSFANLVKSKEVERGKTKEKLVFDKKLAFDTKSVPVGPIFYTVTKDLQISLQLLLDDNCLLLKLRTAPYIESPNAAAGLSSLSINTMASPLLPGQTLQAGMSQQQRPNYPTYPNMTVDYSNQLELRTVGGKLDTSGKPTETVKLESQKLKLSPKGDSVVIKSIPLSKLENKGFISNLFSSKSDSNKLYLDIKLSFFVIDASFGEIYDEMINSKLAAAQELNDQLFRDGQQDVKLTLARLEKARILKEEISQVKSKFKEHMTPKTQEKGYKEILDDITKPINVLCIVLLGFFVQLLLIVNPTLRNRTFF